MIVRRVRVTEDGRIEVVLTNNRGVLFTSAQAVRGAAMAALERLGLEGRAALALIRAARPRDIEGTDLLNVIGEEA